MDDRAPRLGAALAGCVILLTALAAPAAGPDGGPLSIEALLVARSGADERIEETIVFDPEDIDVAYGLMESEWPGLGTLVARGAAATSSPLDAMMLFEGIQAVRDRLNLPPEDPAEWIQDRDYTTPESLDEKERRQFESTDNQWFPGN